MIKPEIRLLISIERAQVEFTLKPQVRNVLSADS